MAGIDQRPEIFYGQASVREAAAKKQPPVKKITLNDWKKVLPEGPLKDMIIQRMRERKKRRPLSPGTGPGIAGNKEKKAPGGKVKRHPGAE